MLAHPIAGPHPAHAVIVASRGSLCSLRPDSVERRGSYFFGALAILHCCNCEARQCRSNLGRRGREITTPRLGGAWQQHGRLHPMPHANKASPLCLDWLSNKRASCVQDSRGLVPDSVLRLIGMVSPDFRPPDLLLKWRLNELLYLPACPLFWIVPDYP